MQVQRESPSLRDWIERHWLYVVLILILVPMISGTADALNVLDRLTAAVRELSTDPREVDYARLQRVRADVNIVQVEQVWGSPTFTREAPNGRLVEKIFEGPGYWLTAVQDRVGTISMLAITACDREFTPTIQTAAGSKVTLNRTSVLETGWDHATVYYNVPANTPFFYYRSLPSGRPSGFQESVIGISDACDLTEEQGALWVALQTNLDAAHMQRVLSAVRINTYAETASGTSLHAVLGELTGFTEAERPDQRPDGLVGSWFMIGPDRTLVRTLVRDRSGG